MRNLVIYSLILLFSACTSQVNKDDTSQKESSELNTKILLDHLSTRALQDSETIPFDSLLIPRTITEDGQLKGRPSKDWTSGFYPGMLWQLYGYSKNDKLKEAAVKWSSFVEKEKYDGGTHDLGFKIYCPFGNAYRITKDETYKEVFVQAAKTLSTRFNPTVGAIRSWDHSQDKWAYPVIIDNMMNLEMLFEATRVTGDSTYYHIANTHAMTTLNNHFREDNSSYHVLDYDVLTGDVVKKNTHQGLGHESDWSRGQAWGLYGFTTVYRYTKNLKYLDQAKKIASFIFTNENLPKDKIPYWDYDAPNIPNEPRDVSAATVAASALYELAQYDLVNANQYYSWANQVLNNLNVENYKCDIAPFFLKHSVGSIPGNFELDVPIIYADYYYIEALLRRNELETK